MDFEIGPEDSLDDNFGSDVSESFDLLSTLVISIGLTCRI